MDSDDDSDDELMLHRLASGGTIDYDDWPKLLESVISRFLNIVEFEYPIPVIPPPRRTQSKLPQPPHPGQQSSDASNGVGVGSSSQAQESGPSQGAGGESKEGVDKENADPGAAVAGGDGESNDNDAAAAPASASASASASDAPAKDPSESAAEPSTSAAEPSTSAAEAEASTAAGASSGPAITAPDSPPAMPKPILDLVDYIVTTLRTTFHTYPPHSIQRLAELIIAPRQNYRYLASYLHAVDRVVSVTSGSNVFPLPPAEPSAEAMAALQSVMIPSAPADSDSDDEMEGVGLALASNPASDNPLGALLTPIPWLRARPTNVADDSSGDTDDDGSSPPDSTDGSEMAFSAAGSSTGSVHGGANASRAPASLLQQQQQLQSSASSSQQLLQQQQTPQHRMEVRTEATETIEGPNGMGSIETVSVSINGIHSHGRLAMAVQQQQQRGITQGELLRQEQTAGVVPVSQLARVAAARAAAASGMAFGGRFRPGAHDDDDDEDEDDEDNDHDVDDMDDHEDEDMDRHALHGGRPVPSSVLGSNAESAQPDTTEDTDMGGVDPENTDVPTTAGESAKEDKGKGVEGKDKEADDGDDDEIPHARGPQVIGAADMGPQRSSRASGASGGGKGSAGLLIGSAADASQVDMRDIDVEAAVGRKASALPPGAVAAPIVPFSSRESVKEQLGENEPPLAATPPVRSTTPKREAENELEPGGPPKKRKEDHKEGGDEKDSPAAGGSGEATAASQKNEPEDMPVDATADESAEKDKGASSAE